MYLLVDLGALVDCPDGVLHVDVRLERLQETREDVTVRDPEVEVPPVRPSSVSMSAATAMISASAAGSDEPKMSTFVW